MINSSSYVSILILLFLTATPTPTTNAASAAAARPNEAQQFMGLQNAARSWMRLPPLVWDPKLARYAARYAGRRRSDCAMVHSNGPYGENIFWGSGGGGWTGAQAAAAWVSERRGYSYRSNTCANGQDCGHYTQIVWRGTSRIGCARAVCDGGKGVFMICNYDPPGNYMGERPY